MPLRAWEDAVLVITGGASGIGAALGRALARRRALVVLADRQGDLAREQAASIRKEGGRAEAAPLDVRDAAAVEALVGDVFARYGRLDYLFNNAGTAVAAEANDHTLEDWRHVIDVNLMGVIYGIHAAYPRMVHQGFGHIVNTASMAGLVPVSMATSYAAAKHAVVGLSRSLRTEARDYGVRVSVLCPGVIRTPILRGGGRYGRTAPDLPVDAQSAMWERLKPMDVDIFAAKVLDQVERDRSVIIVPAWWRTFDWLNRLCRPLADALSLRTSRKTKAEFAAAASRPVR